MTLKSHLPIGLGAGIASTLLFVSLASQSVLAIALFYIAPLPILLAAIGWSQAAGLIAAGVAGLCVLAVVGVELGVLHLASVGLPAWWLSYLALLARPSETGDEAPDWYPVGRLVVWTAAIAIALAGLAVLVIGGSVEGMDAILRQRLGEMFASGAPDVLPQEVDRDTLIGLMAATMPPAFAASWLAVTLLNLWIASRVARASGRLARPWPDLAATAVPNLLLIVFTAAVLGMFLPEPIGFMGRVAATVLLVVLALVGLAVLHAGTRGLASRGFILMAVYLLLMVQPATLFVVAVIGIAEQIFGLRNRLARRSSSNHSNT